MSWPPCGPPGVAWDVVVRCFRPGAGASPEPGRRARAKLPIVRRIRQRRGCLPTGTCPRRWRTKDNQPADGEPATIRGGRPRDVVAEPVERGRAPAAGSPSRAHGQRPRCALVIEASSRPCASKAAVTPVSAACTTGRPVSAARSAPSEACWAGAQLSGTWSRRSGTRSAGRPGRRPPGTCRGRRTRSRSARRAGAAARPGRRVDQLRPVARDHVARRRLADPGQPAERARNGMYSPNGTSRVFVYEPPRSRAGRPAARPWTCRRRARRNPG